MKAAAMIAAGGIWAIAAAQTDSALQILDSAFAGICFGSGIMWWFMGELK